MISHSLALLWHRHKQLAIQEEREDIRLNSRLLARLEEKIDGNGRCARLLLNLQLLRDGYAPAFLLSKWKRRYLQALQSADAGKYTPLVNLIGQAIEAGLDFYLDASLASQMSTICY